MCSLCSSYRSHPGQICAYGLSSIVEALKTCADQLPSYSSRLEKTRAAHVAHMLSSPVSYPRKEVGELFCLGCELVRTHSWRVVLTYDRKWIRACVCLFLIANRHEKSFSINTAYQCCQPSELGCIMALSVQKK